MRRERRKKLRKAARTTPPRVSRNRDLHEPVPAVAFVDSSRTGAMSDVRFWLQQSSNGTLRRVSIESRSPSPTRGSRDGRVTPPDRASTSQGSASRARSPADAGSEPDATETKPQDGRQHLRVEQKQKERRLSDPGPIVLRITEWFSGPGTPPSRPAEGAEGQRRASMFDRVPAAAKEMVAEVAKRRHSQSPSPAA